jgi:hypothetical protein
MSYTFTSPIKNYNNKETLNHCSEIKKKVNDIFENSTNILMVGWRFDSDATFVKHLLDCGKNVTIVEIFPKNHATIPEGVTGILADIRDYEVDKNYDLFLWQHGPEHIHAHEVTKLLNRIQSKFKYIILEAPNGQNAQGVMYDNPYEEHISTWGTEDFINLGLEYITYAGPTNDHFILGYKINESPISS